MDSLRNFIEAAFFHSWQRTGMVIGGIVLAIALPITIFLTSQQQDLRQRASGGNCPVGSKQTFNLGGTRVIATWQMKGTQCCPVAAQGTVTSSCYGPTPAPVSDNGSLDPNDRWGGAGDYCGNAAPLSCSSCATETNCKSVGCTWVPQTNSASRGYCTDTKGSSSPINNSDTTITIPGTSKTTAGGSDIGSTSGIGGTSSGGSIAACEECNAQRGRIYTQYNIGGAPVYVCARDIDFGGFPTRSTSTSSSTRITDCSILGPTAAPTKAPTATTTKAPTKTPTKAPTKTPTKAPTKTPTPIGDPAPSSTKTPTPTTKPTATPTTVPSATSTTTPTTTNTPSPTVTPSPTTTPYPTTTPIPTPTAEPNSTAISLNLSLPGIDSSAQIEGQGPNSNNENPLRENRLVELLLRSSDGSDVTTLASGDDNPASGVLTFDPNTFSYKGTVDLNDLPTGNYLVLVRMDNTLYSQTPGFPVITEGQTASTSAMKLVSGNVDMSSTSSDELDLADYNMILACLKNKPACQNEDRVRADLNDDHKIDRIDVVLLQRGLETRKGASQI